MAVSYGVSFPVMVALVVIAFVAYMKVNEFAYVCVSFN